MVEKFSNWYGLSDTFYYHKLINQFCIVIVQVLIFAEKKQDVDAIHEYLLLKGVEAVSIHGGKGFPILSFIIQAMFINVPTLDLC